MQPPYYFPHKREESYSPVERVRQWFEKRGDVVEARDVQDDAEFYYKGDLMILRTDGTRQFVEVKSEPSYTRHTTENLAIERWSDTAKHTPGGPWSTQADFYVHIYADGLLVVMNRKHLVAWIEGELSRDKNTFTYREIPNRGWTTGTYLIPRGRVRSALGQWMREYDLE